MKKIVFLLISFISTIGLIRAQFKDIQIKTALQNQYQSGMVSLDVNLSEQSQPATALHCRLSDSRGKLLVEKFYPISTNIQTINVQLPEVHQPSLWNAEAPVLYTLDIYLQKKNKTTLDHQQRKIAFRHLEMKGKELWLNGRPIRIKGVNLRSLTSYPTNYPWIKDIKQWKLHHVNAIRISDTPQNNELYDLCNRYGIYILNEQEGWDPTHPALREGCLWEWPNEDLPVKLEEMKKLYQNIRFVDFNREAGTISIQNLYDFTRLNRFKFYYLIRDHGKVVYRNELKGVDAAPGETIICHGLKGINLERNTTGDVRIEFYAQHRTAAPFFPQGSLAAREQTYIHTFFRPEKPAAITQKKIEKKVETATSVSFIGKDLKLVFDKESGQLISYQHQGEEYLHQAHGLHPFFWRAPTSNDRLARFPEVLQAWKNASNQPVKATSFLCSREKDGTNLIKVTYHFPQTDAEWEIIYKIHADGILKIDNRFVAEGNQAPIIPRVGLRMQLIRDFTTVDYFGRGPRTNYRDCRTAQFLGEYTSDISATTEVYKKPQENGHRTDIYWCAIHGSLKGGLLFVADRTFEMNLSKQLLEDLEKGLNKKVDFVDCFIDYRMMGIGVDNRAGTPVQEPYLIRPGKENVIEYGFTIIPFSKNEDYKRMILKY